MDLLGHVIELALAVVLLVASVSKLLSLERWKSSLSNYRIALLRSPIVVWAVPVNELVIAPLLAARIEPLGAVAACALFAGFAITLALALRRGATGRCDCFGELLPTNIGASSIARAAFLSATALLIVAVPASAGPELSARGVIVVGTSL